MPSLFYSIFLTLVRQTPPNSVARVSGEVFPARALLVGSTLASRGAASSYDGSSRCCPEAPAHGPPAPRSASSHWTGLFPASHPSGAPWVLSDSAALSSWTPLRPGLPPRPCPSGLLPGPLRSGSQASALSFPHGPEHDSRAAPLRPVYVHAATGNPGRELAASRGKECSRVTSQHTHTTLNLSVHAARMPVPS